MIFIPNTEGIFPDLPDTIYHNHQACPEINRGLVVEMITRSPLHVKSLIDGTQIRKVTKAMEAGTLIDKALLEPDRFKEGLSHWVIPEGMDLRKTDGLAWKKDHPGLPYIRAKNNSPDEASAEDIQGMIASVLANPEGRRIVEQSTKQESVFCKDKDTGLLRKCRLDTRLLDSNSRITITDLKSIFLGGTTDDNFSKQCGRKGYFIQHPFYSDIVQDLLGEKPFFLFMVVERKPPYACRIFQIHDEGVWAGRELCKRAMGRFAECKQSGIWPGYQDPGGIKVIKLQRWVLRQVEETTQ